MAAVATATLPLACASPPDVRAAPPERAVSTAREYELWTNAQSVFERRCVVCHGCYDAPCQLKLGSYEGIERGATAALVYDAARLVAAQPTRLGTDAHGRAAWRELGFHPVLAEGADAAATDSLILDMLELKRVRPLPTSLDLTKDFTFGLDRKAECVERGEFASYAKEHPHWGMPYALPAVSTDEHTAIEAWIKAGAPSGAPVRTAPAVSALIDEFERFLNEDTTKAQLVARYIYEHLFLASVRFEEPKAAADPQLFRLVRTAEPSGPIREIPTRRPFEDPEVKRVYYRFERRTEKPLEKTLMPYLLDRARLARWQKLFFETPYRVDSLPGYASDVSANPFRAFAALPVTSRYRFMLEEARFTLMGFIKGPVCRGQVALNVIQDRFWIYFVDPEVRFHADQAGFLSSTRLDLDMPAESGSSAFPTMWLGYGAAHDRYVQKRAEFLEQATRDGRGVGPGLIWDGDGKNDNAALTVFRHFDSATVEKGLVGAAPKTAWVVDYPLLERIHYLLVAGFDVFGNVTHQLASRLYMDFLRMEGEAGFLMLLPPERRRALVDAWYRGVSGKTKERVVAELVGRSGAPSIQYTKKTPELEAFNLLEQRVRPVVRREFELARVEDPTLAAQFTRLSQLRGGPVSHLSETSFLALRTGENTTSYFTLLRDSAHANVSELFREESRRLPAEDQLTVVPGLLGAYPNALFALSAGDFEAFVDAVSKLASDEQYRALRTRFGVLRTSEGFWEFSDELNGAHVRASPVEHGLLDYNRLEPY